MFLPVDEEARRLSRTKHKELTTARSERVALTYVCERKGLVCLPALHQQPTKEGGGNSKDTFLSEMERRQQLTCSNIKKDELAKIRGGRYDDDDDDDDGMVVGAPMDVPTGSDEEDGQEDAENTDDPDDESRRLEEGIFTVSEVTAVNEVMGNNNTAALSSSTTPGTIVSLGAAGATVSGQSIPFVQPEPRGDQELGSVIEAGVSAVTPRSDEGTGGSREVSDSSSATEVSDPREERGPSLHVTCLHS